jgi:exonuclease III
MAPFLSLAVWNANGLSQHAEELQTFLNCRHIDIMLISETHFTHKSYLRIPHYTIYHTNIQQELPVAARPSS